MPELFIGNMTKQNFQFTYRALERPGVIYQIIPIGGQIRISPNGANIDLSTQEIDYILNQHRGYGILAIEDMNKINSSSALCYSIGKQISVEKLHRAMRKKEDALIETGKKTRQEAALAVNSQIEEQIGAPLNKLEMSFAEEEPRAGFSDDGEHLAEGIRISRSETVGRGSRIQ